MVAVVMAIPGEEKKQQKNSTTRRKKKVAVLERWEHERDMFQPPGSMSVCERGA